MTIVIGSNETYNYQGVGGSPRSFTDGETVVVTWYNNSSSPVTLTPAVSFNDPNRRYVDPAGTWYDMTSATIAPYSVAKSQYAVSPSTAGTYSLVNVNVNYTNNQVIVCDKIELIRGDLIPPTSGLLPAPTNIRVK
jgi:hypothetical protein